METFGRKIRRKRNSGCHKDHREEGPTKRDLRIAVRSNHENSQVEELKTLVSKVNSRAVVCGSWNHEQTSQDSGYIRTNAETIQVIS